MTRDEIVHIARLARLAIPEEELRGFAASFGQIVDYVGQLASLDTSGVEPAEYALDVHDALRADEPAPSLRPEEVMHNNPAGDAALFRVPKILEG